MLILPVKILGKNEESKQYLKVLDITKKNIESSNAPIDITSIVLISIATVIIIIAGVFMETSSAIIILTPVFLPLVQGLGVDLIHFGILFVVGIAIGMITPPVAINLFVASGITGMPIEMIAKAVIPYLLGLLFVFLLIVYLPMMFPALII